jgi:hypothetical protein
MTPNPENSHPGIIKAVWLHMLVEGGHWNANEMADLMRCCRKRMDSVICGMVKRGYLAKFREGERKNGAAYGVTLACRIPSDITLRDLAATPHQTAKVCEQISRGWIGRKASSGKPAEAMAANDTHRAAA